MELGISLYPEQERMEDITAYIQLAGKYGFTKIFTSMFSVAGEANEVLAYFKNLCDIAHENHMEVCIDANAKMFEKFGASEKDIRVFKNIGVDEIRMDFCFGDERDILLVENKENIKIQFSAFMTELLQPIIAKCKEPSKITICHNFYPERYTGVSRDEFMRLNKFWKERDMKIGAFISTNVSDAHGPWPVYNGLPTLEEHRDRPVDFQVRELMAMKDVDLIMFGNAFASENELRAVQQAVKEKDIDKEYGEFEKMLIAAVPTVGKNSVVLHVEEEVGINEVEKKILYEFRRHCDLGDSSEYMLRSRITRMLYGKESIPHRTCKKEYFTKGDILVVNDNLKHYCGELEICIKDMKNDGQRNIVGYLNDDEIQLIPYLKAGTFFSFR